MLTITSPANGATVKGVVTVQVTESNVPLVDFLVDGIQVGEATSAPFSYSWDTTKLVDGQHTIEARSADGTVESSVTVTTANGVKPPPTSSSGLAMVAYGGSLASKSHLKDGTYAVVVGDWRDAPLLATVSGEGYAYTVTTDGPTQANAAEFVILDPLGNSGLPGALTPDKYIAKCAALKAANPGLKGIFLDNCVALGNDLPTVNQRRGGVTEAQFLAAIKQVSAGLASHGLKWTANTGGFISGDNRSNDGSLWILWAQTIAPYFAHLVCENWQEATFHVPPVKRLRGTAWYQQWDGWQRCVGAVPGKFIGITYEFNGDTSYGVYGRASMLTAPGNVPGNLFFANAGNKGPDPFGQPWMKANPVPRVDPVSGTASL